MIVYILMLCAFAVATAEFVIVGVLPEVATDLGVSLPTAGLLVTVFMVVAAVGGPTLAVATRKIPRRTLLVAVMVCALGSAVLASFADGYQVLLVARVGSALAQALFMAVASQVAMASVPPERQTAAVAKVFNGFALATVIGLPIGTLVGQAFGWHATFVLVAVVSAVGLLGVLRYCPEVPYEPGDSMLASISALGRRTVLLGMLLTLLAFTGFMTVFTYVAPTLTEVTGLTSGQVTAALFVYGAGTIAGNWVAGRVPIGEISRVLPVVLGVLAVMLVAQGLLLRHAVTAAVGLFVLGAAGMMTAPLIQTFLMGQAGPVAGGLVAATNISAAAAAAAIGPVLGGAVISAGWGFDRVGTVAASPVAGAVLVALLLRVSIRPNVAAERETMTQP